MNKNELMEDIIKRLPIMGEIYDVTDGKNGLVEVHFYDHFKDYGNYRFYIEVETEYTAEELQGLVGRHNPIPK